MKKIAFCLALGLFAAACACAAEPKRPNIVVLVADDWGFSDVGAFGGEIATPRLDELARNGVRFSNFHVAASCSPTRSMLLTGVDNHRNGVGNLREAMPQEHLGKPGYLGSLDTNVVTVATLLQDAGYRTAIAGKWNVGSEPHNLPNRRGFDRSIVQGDTGSDNWEPSKRYLPHSDKVHWFENGLPAAMPSTFYSSAYFVDRMLEYLKAGPKEGKPFFAYLGFQANHVPVQAPKEFIDKYKGRYNDGWAVLRTERRNKAIALGLIPKDTPMVTMSTTADWNKLSPKEKLYEAKRMEVYAGMADAMDFHVGRLVDYLKQTGEFDNTVFVFLSDNGPEGNDYNEAKLWLLTQYSLDIEKMGAKGGYGVPGPSWASASAAPLSSYKFYAGEGGIRSPLIISGAAGALRNSIHTSFAHVNDIVPTLLELAQVAAPGADYKGAQIAPLAGRSLVSVIRGQSPSVYPADQAVGYELSGNLALFKGGLKLVKNTPPLGDGAWHLYDISKDPGETTDLQLTLPDAFKTMQQDYAQYAQSHGVLPMPANYKPARQVFINGLHNYWIPTYRNTVLAGLAGLAGVLLLWLYKKRRKSTGAPT